MLEPAAGIRAQVKNESVVAIRYLAAHHLDFRFHDLLHVASHAFGIVVAFAVDHDAMRNAFHVEYQCLEVAGFKWRVVKDVEVLGAKSILLTGHGWKSSGDFPNVRCEHANS